MRTFKDLLYVALFLVVLFLVFIGTGKCQVPVAITPPPHLQFTDSSGAVLANGFLFTYIAGTTTLSNTYVDSTGTIQNPNPIPLDATGAPSNGSTQTGIWLANQSYKFCAYDSSMVQQWCTDNLTGYLGLLNTVNSWLFQQTFESPIVITATDNQIILGAVGNQTTLDAPPPAGNIALHLPNTADTLVGRATTDTLTNKTLTLPSFNGSCSLNVANQNPTGTTINTLTKLVNAPSQAQIFGTADTAGVVGITASGAGSTGSACIQQWGTASCVFDGATVASNYVVPSVLVAGNCHDSGTASSSTPPSGAVGVALSTNGGGGTYSMYLLTGAGGGNSLLCVDASSLTVNANTTANQVMKTCQFSAGSLNVLNKAFRLRSYTAVVPVGASTNVLSIGTGTSSALGTFQQIITEAASAAHMSQFTDIDCVVTGTGGTGQIQCQGAVNNSISATPIVTPTTFTVDLTVPLFVGTACSFNAASAANACSDSYFSVQRLN